MKIDVQSIFEKAIANGNFIRLKEESSIGIYYSLDENKQPSIAFLTKIPPTEIESTKCIKVSQFEESPKVYWTKMGLQSPAARLTFYSLCNDLIETAQKYNDENEAILAVANRYRNWKKLFQGSPKKMSEEEYKGLLGELLFLYKKMIPYYGVNVAINSWSGANKTAKDFSVKEEWYEVKSTSSSSSEVLISSLTQLESENEGYLIVVKTEKMSMEYSDGMSSVDEVANAIISQIDNEKVKDNFIYKLNEYGFDLEEKENENNRYRFVSLNSYRVDKSFPKITTQEVPCEAITKVAYSLSLAAIDGFKEDIL